MYTMPSMPYFGTHTFNPFFLHAMITPVAFSFLLLKNRIVNKQAYS